MKIEITTLIENNPDDHEQLSNEHGLSLFIEADGVNILFDTGKSGDFIQNADKLGKDLTSLDNIIISHGHYDHSGGFEKLVDTIEKIPKLIIGAEFFNPKYKKIGEKEFKYIGSLFNEEYIFKKHIPMKKVKENIYCITENIMVLHNFIRDTEFEKLNDKFFISGREGYMGTPPNQGDSYLQDEFLDEVALGIATEKGLVVIVGCSHVGIVNILQTIRKRIDMPIYAVIGGTHLIEADESRIENTISFFQDMNIELVAVSHCTGEKGVRLIKENLLDKFVFNNTGNVIKFEM